MPAQVLPRPGLSDHAQHINRPVFSKKKLMSFALEVGDARTNPSCRLVSINGIQLLKCRHEPGNVLPIAGMHYIQIEGRHRRSVQRDAYTVDDNEINAMPRQDCQYLEEPRNRTLHGV